MTESLEKWGSSYRLIAAEKWKSKSAAMGRDVTQAFVDYACPAMGMKVLDLASGTGEPAISLASKVGPEGDVIALDLSSELLAIAKQRAEQRRLTNFHVRVADAQELPFGDNTFDLITCRFGVMFFADCEKTLMEASRVLKRSGRVCFVAWGPFDQPYWKCTMGVAHRHVGGPLLEASSANMFRFADPGSLAKLLHLAGFTAVEEETKQLPWTWPGSAEEAWEYARTVSAPFRTMLERIPENKHALIDAEVHEAVRKFEDGNRIKFGVTVVFASARKP